jgi:hypothetical protein
MVAICTFCGAELHERMADDRYLCGACQRVTTGRELREAMTGYDPDDELEDDRQSFLKTVLGILLIVAVLALLWAPIIWTGWRWWEVLF